MQHNTEKNSRMAFIIIDSALKIKLDENNWITKQKKTETKIRGAIICLQFCVWKTIQVILLTSKAIDNQTKNRLYVIITII